MRRQTTTTQSLSRVLSVGSRGKKISAQRKEHFCFSAVHRLNRMDRIVAMVPRRPTPKLLFQAVEELRGWLLPNSHRAIALDVTVTAHRTKTRTRFAELSAQHHQVHDLLNVGDRVFVLRQSHGPAKDHSLGFNKD